MGLRTKFREHRARRHEYKERLARVPDEVIDPTSATGKPAQLQIKVLPAACNEVYRDIRAEEEERYPQEQ